MNDHKFELLKAAKDKLTIEDALWLYELGIQLYVRMEKLSVLSLNTRSQYKQLL